MDHGNKKIAKNTFFLYGRLIFVLLVSLYTVRLVLNALGVVDYGVYNVVGGFVSMFGFLNTSMANATQRFYNYEIGKNGEEASIKVYNAAFRTQIILAGILLLLSEFVGIWYVNTMMDLPYDKIWGANWLLQFSILSLVFTIIQVPYAAATIAYEKMNFYAIVGVVDVILKLCIAFGVKYYSGDKLLLYGLLIVIISVANYLMYFVFTKKSFPWLKLSWEQYSKKIQKEMLSFSGWNLFGSFAFMLRGQGLDILLNYFFGVVINAANGIASQISSALQQFSTNLIIAFKPQLVQSYGKGNIERTRELFFLMSKTAYTLLIMLSVPMIININFILKIWLGNDIPQYTSDFLILVIITVLINCFHTPITQVIHATGLIKKFQIGTSIIITGIIPLSWLVFRLGGSPTSCYMICILIYIINQVYALLTLKKVFDYSYSKYFKDVLMRCLVITFILILAGYVITKVITNDLMVFVISCLVSCGLSIFLYYLIMINVHQRREILHLIYKITKRY